MAYQVFTSIPGTPGACAYYRTQLPIQTMLKLGLDIEPVIDDGTFGLSTTDRALLFSESDITHIYQVISPAVLHQMEGVDAFKPMYDRSGKLRYPPTFIADTDDDVFNVGPLNFSYGILGIKRPDGSPLVEGDEISVAHPLEFAAPDVSAALDAKSPLPIAGTQVEHNGQHYIYDVDAQWHPRILLWKDGENFSISANVERLETWRKVMRLCKLITCSTPRVEAAIKRELGPDAPTYVTHNSIDFGEYPKIELRDHPDEVRILWQGSASHHEDLWPLNKALSNVARKYPQAKWIFWGAPYKWAANNLPAGSVETIDWIPYPSYKLRLSTIGHDINLAPLAPSAFNQSRSGIKWYESSAVWYPAATVATNTGPYADEMEDGVTGMLFNTPDEFEQKMGALIEDATLRKTLASNAKDWVRTNRDNKAAAIRLFSKWVEVREGHKLTMPPAVTQAENEEKSADTSDNEPRPDEPANVAGSGQ